MRSQGDAFRRSINIRVFVFALPLFVFVSAIFSGLEVVAIVSGALMVLQISILVLYFWLFRHADPALLAAPIDPAIRMHWRYLRPIKYPYEGPVGSVQREDAQDQSIDRSIKNEQARRIVTLIEPGRCREPVLHTAGIPARCRVVVKRP